MKCVCRTRCQARLDSGKIKTYAKGDVDDFIICPPHFEILAGEVKEAAPIDFAKAGEQELLESDYDVDELKKFIEDNFDRKPGKRGKEKLVDFLLDCRFRATTDADINGVI